MANKNRGEVTEKVGGKNMTFRLSANEWCELEAEFGKTTDEILGLFFERIEGDHIDFRLMRSLFRASLRSHDPEITNESAGDIMTSLGLVESAGLLAQIIAASMPDAEDAANPPKRGAGTGKPSSKTTSR